MNNMPFRRAVAVAAALLAVLLVSQAHAQSTLLQGGPWQPGHTLMYVGQNSSQAIVQDSGSAAGGSLGVGLNELLLAARGAGAAPHVAQGTGPLGTNFCDYDGPKTNPTGYHYLCFSANAGAGGGLLAYGAAGGASPLPMTASINGVSYPFPFASGGIVGPSTTVVGDLPTWNNTVGTLLSDSGVPLASLAPLASPHFTGVPTAPTASVGTSTTQVATTAFVQSTAGYATILVATAAGNVTPSTTPTEIMVAKATPATTTVTLPAASNWPNCASQQPGACPVYRVKDYARNSATFPITVVAADGALLDGQSSFVIDGNGAEYGLTLAGTAWSVN